jgi:hypothetical protein
MNTQLFFATFGRILQGVNFNWPLGGSLIGISTSVLSFYQKNNFAPVFSTEQQERNAYKISNAEPLQT